MNTDDDDDIADDEDEDEVVDDEDDDASDQVGSRPDASRGTVDSGPSGKPDGGAQKDAGGSSDAGDAGNEDTGRDAGSTADSGKPDASGGKAVRPPCLQKPSQVVALGDSYVGLPTVLIPKVEDLARADGALKDGENYRDYGVPGTILGSPESPGDIPPMLDQALQEDDDIKAVIMDGGGNDIIGTVVCLAAADDFCKDIVHDCMAMVRQMADKAKAAGISDVVYFLYPHVPIGGDEILDYAVEQAKVLTAELSTDTFRAHLVDTRQAFEGHPEYFGLDPIHPNEDGARVIAKLVWDTMKEKCIAQPESSGCCEP